MSGLLPRRRPQQNPELALAARFGLPDQQPVEQNYQQIPKDSAKPRRLERSFGSSFGAIGGTILGGAGNRAVRFLGG